MSPVCIYYSSNLASFLLEHCSLMVYAKPVPCLALLAHLWFSCLFLVRD